MANFNVPVNAFKSSKGKNIASCNGYSYFERAPPKEGATKRLFRCNNTNRCNGGLWTNLDMTMGQERGRHLEHCEPDHEKCRIAQVKSQMAEAAATTTQPMPQLYSTFKQQLAAEPTVAARFKDFKSADSVLYRKRNRQLNDNPQALADIAIPQEMQVTEGTNHQFLLHQSATNDLLIFTTDENIRKLAALTEWSLDGMFSFIPRLYSDQNGQFWTWHAFWGKKLLPMVYVLSTSKIQLRYIEIIRIVKDRALALGVVLAPTKISCDFESGLLPALAAEFPGVNVTGCHYHFSQCIYRHMQGLGLTNLYTNQADAAFRLAVRSLMASAFLPVDRVRPWFDEFQDTMPLNILAQMHGLLDYYDIQWLQPDLMPLWNMHQVERRTNNNLEGWNNGFQKRLGKHPRPGFMKFVSSLRAEQADTEASLHQLAAGQSLVRENKTYKEVNQRIRTLTNIYIANRAPNNIEPEMAYVRGISYNLSQPKHLSL